MDDFRWDYYKDGNKFYKVMNLMVVYERGLIIWVEWVEINFDLFKIKVIFCISLLRFIIFFFNFIILNI